jgi:hypothetical protein
MDREEMLLRAGYYAGMAGRLLGDRSYEQRWKGHAEDITEVDYMLMTSEIQRRLVAAGFIGPDEDPWEMPRPAARNGVKK